MSDKFYKDIQVIKFCKVCGVSFRPVRGSLAGRIGLCKEHRPIFYKEWYQKFSKPYLARMTPEARARYKLKQYEVWLAWTKKNLDKRRLQALASYHRNKDKHKGRRHRATHEIKPASRI